MHVKIDTAVCGRVGQRPVKVRAGDNRADSGNNGAMYIHV